MKSFMSFTLLLLACTYTNAITTNDLVRSTCNQTPDPTTCESELRSDPRSSKAADTESLIMIMIDAVNSRFSDALRVANGLTRKTHDPAMTRALKNCVRLFQVVLDYNVQEARNAVQLGNPKFGEQAMVDAGNEADACRDGFPGGKVPSELAGRARKLRGVSSVAASLIKTME